MGGRILAKGRLRLFLYPVFGRFVHTRSALVGQTVLVMAGCACFAFLMFVRQYQTVCARTAGHWI